MSMGNAAYSAESWQEAKDWYQKAIDVEPANSDARYNFAKAAMRLRNVDSIGLMLKMMNNSGGGDITAGLDKQEILDIYYGTDEAQQQIKVISDGECTSGKIQPADIYLDYAFVLTLKSISLIYKTMDDLNKLAGIAGDFLVMTDSGITIANWDTLTSTQQAEIIDTIGELVDDADEVIDLVVSDPQQAEALKAMVDKFNYIWGQS